MSNLDEYEFGLIIININGEDIQARPIEWTETGKATKYHTTCPFCGHLIEFMKNDEFFECKECDIIGNNVMADPNKFNYKEIDNLDVDDIDELLSDIKVELGDEEDTGKVYIPVNKVQYNDANQCPGCGVEQEGPCLKCFFSDDAPFQEVNISSISAGETICILDNKKIKHEVHTW